MKRIIGLMFLASFSPAGSFADVAPDNVDVSTTELSAILSNRGVIQAVRKYSGGPRFGIDTIEHFPGSPGNYGIEINGCGIRVHVKSHFKAGAKKVVVDSITAESEAICK